MKKVMLSVLAVAIATASVIANNNVPAKKAKQATCTSCPKGKQCSKTACSKPGCCK